MKKLIVSLVLLALSAAAGFAAYLYWLSPETVVCTRLAQLCDIESPTLIEECKGILDRVTDAQGDGMRDAAKCIAESSSCGEATGCVMGAGLGIGLKELAPLLNPSQGLVDDVLKGVKRGAEGLLD